MRRITAVVLAALLAAPPVNLVSAPVNGTVQGIVTVEGRPVSGLVLALVALNTGEVHKTESGQAGAFLLRVAPGDYIITTGGQAGLAVGRAPTRLTVPAGGVTSTQLDLVPLPVVSAGLTRVAWNQEQPQPPPTTLAPAQEPVATLEGVAIQHDPIGCFIAGEFPLVEAVIEPTQEVARARVYFRAAGGDWYFVEMSPQEGQFLGKLPRPKLEASPITYYVQAITTEFSEVRTSQNSGIVVEKKEDCRDKVAAIGPDGPVQVFAAATGAAISPIGFAVGGLAIAGGTVLLLLAGATAAGVGTAIAVNNPEPTPSPTPTPTPTPEPEPSPTPRPTPTPTPSPTPVPSPPPTSALR